jgi:hypothetical protein
LYNGFITSFENYLNLNSHALLHYYLIAAIKDEKIIPQAIPSFLALYVISDMSERSRSKNAAVTVAQPKSRKKPTEFKRN